MASAARIRVNIMARLPAGNLLCSCKETLTFTLESKEIDLAAVDDDTLLLDDDTEDVICLLDEHDSW